MYFKAAGEGNGEGQDSSSSGTYKPMPQTPPKPLTKEILNKLREIVEQKKAKS